MDRILWLLSAVAQLSTPPGSSTADGGAGAAATGGQGGGMWGSLLTFLPMMLAIMFIWILIMQKPQQRDQQKLQKLLADLKKNDRVVTAGGILGSVVNVSGDSEFVTIRIDEANNTKLQVLKQSIVRVLKDAEPSKETATKQS